MRRVFTALDALTEKEKKLDDVLVLLTEAQIATQLSFQETERRFQETDKRFQETDRRFQETDRRIEALAQKLTESHMQLDERIKNLVSAIGEFIRTRQ
jgi:hypothetical protein